MSPGSGLRPGPEAGAPIAHVGLASPLRFLRGVGPRRADALERLGLRTVEDLLLQRPRTYLDRSRITPVALLVPGTEVTLRVRATQVRTRRVGGHRSLLTARLEDEPSGRAGWVEGVWFNQAYLAERLQAGEALYVTGDVKTRGGSLRVEVREHEFAAEAGALSAGCIVPVYPLTQGIGLPWLRRLVRRLLDELAESLPELRPEVLPESVRLSRSLRPLAEALPTVHFPPDLEAARRARRRLAYEELFLMQVAFATLRRAAWRPGGARRIPVPPGLDARIRRRFPFPFTAGQDAVVRDLVADLDAGRTMRRLVQGDVGSGKTAVAFYAVLATVAAGAQAAVLVPTDVLAQQHEEGLKRLLEGSRVRVARLAGGEPRALRREVLEGLASGEVQAVVGTHALLQDGVRFRELALAVMDEQHRFGVLQRRDFMAKGAWRGGVHVLAMTATPIPRTLALTFFGDLDVSTIPDRPPGRRPVLTRVVDPGGARAELDFLRRELDAGGRIYVVYPLVEESEDSDLRSAEDGFRRIRERSFRGTSSALLHGRMAAAEKRRVFEDFRAGRVRILVSTSLVEVGVDVPEASVLVVMNAERFGLATLHQLRGRVGRGDRPSTCLLFSSRRGGDAARRLEVLALHDDGFRIAEEDLRLRGPGEFLGTRQHGLPVLRHADLSEDADLMDQARQDATDLVRVDPDLSGPDGGRVAEAVRRTYGERLDLFHVG
ncbi:MAG: ATP-dependent DNA helicase RecG [Planctomycetes bacterium]|nr:ATP-dependent DNA helicase RecG [Planctomycetota bacterium]